MLHLVPDEAPIGPFYVGPTFRGEWPTVECSTWAEAVTVALGFAAEGRGVLVRDASRHLVTTGRRLADACAPFASAAES